MKESRLEFTFPSVSSTVFENHRKTPSNHFLECSQGQDEEIRANPEKNGTCL